MQSLLQKCDHLSFLFYFIKKKKNNEIDYPQKKKNEIKGASQTSVFGIDSSL
jgi:hypothetical protein